MASGESRRVDRNSMTNTCKSTQVELSVSGRNLPNLDFLSKSDPFCVLYTKDPSSGIWREKHRTETIQDNLNPDFATKFLVDYFFGVAVELKFEVYDENNNSKDLSKQGYIGMSQVMLDEIVSSTGGVDLELIGKKKNKGKLLVSGQELDDCKDVVEMLWSASELDKMNTFGKSDPFLAFNRQDSKDKFTVVHRTEVIRNTLDPKWKPFTIPLNKLCNGDFHRPIKIECWDWNKNGSHANMGEVTTSVDGLKSGKGNYNVYEIVNETKMKKMGRGKYKHSGKIQLNTVNVVRKATFIDYLIGGTELHCTFAVDFGTTNGDMHALDPDKMNLYQQALRAVGMVMENYDRNDSFPALGFGAKDKGDKPIFYMNGHAKNPHCQSLDGVLEAYERSVKSAKPAGPTNMAPAIEHVAKLAESAPPGEHYHVLVILTSGSIDDMNETTSAIVTAACNPLSIILIGIGYHDFKDMMALDGDDERLTTADNEHAERDIVQFVPFRDYVRPGESEDVSQRRLARAVLEEVPEQLLSYMQANYIEPGTTTKYET